MNNNSFINDVIEKIGNVASFANFSTNTKKSDEVKEEDHHPQQLQPQTRQNTRRRSFARVQNVSDFNLLVQVAAKDVIRVEDDAIDRFISFIEKTPKEKYDNSLLKHMVDSWKNEDSQKMFDSSSSSSIDLLQEKSSSSDASSVSHISGGRRTRRGKGRKMRTQKGGGGDDENRKSIFSKMTLQPTLTQVPVVPVAAGEAEEVPQPATEKSLVGVVSSFIRDFRIHVTDTENLKDFFFFVMHREVAKNSQFLGDAINFVAGPLSVDIYSILDKVNIFTSFIKDFLNRLKTVLTEAVENCDGIHSWFQGNLSPLRLFMFEKLIFSRYKRNDEASATSVRDNQKLRVLLTFLTFLLTSVDLGPMKLDVEFPFLLDKVTEEDLSGIIMSLIKENGTLSTNILVDVASSIFNIKTLSMQFLRNIYSSFATESKNVVKQKSLLSTVLESEIIQKFLKAHSTERVTPAEPLSNNQKGEIRRFLKEYTEIRRGSLLHQAVEDLSFLPIVLLLTNLRFYATPTKDSGTAIASPIPIIPPFLNYLRLNLQVDISCFRDYIVSRLVRSKTSSTRDNELMLELPCSFNSAATIQKSMHDNDLIRVRCKYLKRVERKSESRFIRSVQERIPVFVEAFVSIRRHDENAKYRVFFQNDNQFFYQDFRFAFFGISRGIKYLVFDRSTRQSDPRYTTFTPLRL